MASENRRSKTPLVVLVLVAREKGGIPDEAAKDATLQIEGARDRVAADSPWCKVTKR